MLLGYYIKMGDRAGESKCYTNIGAAYDSLGQYQKAIEYQEKALNIFQDIDDTPSLITAYQNLADLYYNNNPERAVEYTHETINLVNQISINLAEHEHKSFYYGRSNRAYRILVKDALKKDKNQAFSYVEESKSKATLKEAVILGEIIGD